MASSYSGCSVLWVLTVQCARAVLESNAARNTSTVSRYFGLTLAVLSPVSYHDQGLVSVKGLQWTSCTFV